MMEMTSKNIRFLSRMGVLGVLGQVVLDMMEEGKDFYACSADLGDPSGFKRFREQYPEKYLNVGIAEQNMIGVAAGLSSDGTPVIATTWAMFAALRCADQLRNFMGYMQRNIKLIGMRSGLVESKSGYTHCNPQDIAYLRAVPGLTILSPCDGQETYKAIWAAMEMEGPVYIRLTGDLLAPVIYKEDFGGYCIGKAIQVRQGEDIAIIGCGAVLAEALKAVELLEEAGISCAVIDMHTIKPLDTGALDKLTAHKLVVTVEEHSIIGGLGGAVAEYFSQDRNAPPVLRLGADDVFPKSGSYQYGLRQYGLTGPQIADSIQTKLRE
ncbi:transketolase family protein [Acutalibacter sp. 1XD8-36]|uniref:transketolase family protein n=1 Tax=Acutalibacter sp. 1XD8-36 TaxID=2320852 RepID=UPI0026374AB3|nr:transketolase C-terminal domain-containing protein [Acutalibacter sp. 1XD8-36]